MQQEALKEGWGIWQSAYHVKHMDAEAGWADVQPWLMPIPYPTEGLLVQVKKESSYLLKNTFETLCHPVLGS